MNIQPQAVNDAIRYNVNKSLANHKVTAEETKRLEHLRSLITSAPKEATDGQSTSIIA